MIASSIQSAYIAIRPVKKRHPIRFDTPMSHSLLSTQQRLHHQFFDQLELIAFLKIEPIIEIIGKAILSEQQQHQANEFARQLHQSGKPDDPHVIVVSGLNESTHTTSSTSSLTLQVKEILFSALCALRTEGQRPAVLSASAVLICEDTQEIILQRRAASVATHPNCLHIIGGAFHPELDRRNGQASLLATIQREVKEETGITIPLQQRQQAGTESHPLSLVKEKTTGFVQCAAIGITISAQAVEQLQENWEGNLLRVGLKELPDLLKDPSWVPSGKAHVMTWLEINGWLQLHSSIH